MLPWVKLEAAGHGIDTSFAPALREVHDFDLARPAKACWRCAPFADFAQLVDLAPINPLGWRFAARLGLERLNGASTARATCLGDLDDPGFGRDVLLPTYVEAARADQPVVHRIAAVANDVFLSYRRLTVPLRARPRAGQPSHLLMLTQLDRALPLIHSRDRSRRLTVREQQCLSLTA